MLYKTISKIIPMSKHKSGWLGAPFRIMWKWGSPKALAISFSSGGTFFFLRSLRGKLNVSWSDVRLSWALTMVSKKRGNICCEWADQNLIASLYLSAPSLLFDRFSSTFFQNFHFRKWGLETITDERWSLNVLHGFKRLYRRICSIWFSFRCITKLWSYLKCRRQNLHRFGRSLSSSISSLNVSWLKKSIIFR